ncbi:hypothetical protein DIPPA_35809 [Diplonema papillatum]|nr:hypothetical protein DIPPA_35809 [Diplonema papillatum]
MPKRPRAEDSADDSMMDDADGDKAKEDAVCPGSATLTEVSQYSGRAQVRENTELMAKRRRLYGVLREAEKKEARRTGEPIRKTSMDEYMKMHEMLNRLRQPHLMYPTHECDVRKLSFWGSRFLNEARDMCLNDPVEDVRRHLCFHGMCFPNSEHVFYDLARRGALAPRAAFLAPLRALRASSSRRSSALARAASFAANVADAAKTSLAILSRAAFSGVSALATPVVSTVVSAAGLPQSALALSVAPFAAPAGHQYLPRPQGSYVNVPIVKRRAAAFLEVVRGLDLYKKSAKTDSPFDAFVLPEDLHELFAKAGVTDVIDFEPVLSYIHSMGHNSVHLVPLGQDSWAVNIRHHDDRTTAAKALNLAGESGLCEMLVAERRLQRRIALHKQHITKTIGRTVETSRLALKNEQKKARVAALNRCIHTNEQHLINIEAMKLEIEQAGSTEAVFSILKAGTLYLQQHNDAIGGAAAVQDMLDSAADAIGQSEEITSTLADTTMIDSRVDDEDVQNDLAALQAEMRSDLASQQDTRPQRGTPVGEVPGLPRHVSDSAAHLVSTPQQVSIGGTPATSSVTKALFGSSASESSHVMSAGAGSSGARQHNRGGTPTVPAPRLSTLATPVFKSKQALPHVAADDEADTPIAERMPAPA